MNEAVERDLRNSAKCVKELIVPVTEEILSGWRLMAVEGNSNEVCNILDKSCGIDYLLHNKKSSVVYGVASRVQYGRNYRTFTVRKDRESQAKTEYQKRNAAMSNGGIYPEYTMQAYIDGGTVSGLALTRTADLMSFIGRGLADEQKTCPDKIGQAKFYVCGWDKMIDNGYKVMEYKKG